MRARRAQNVHTAGEQKQALKVGVAGFEPATSCSQSMRANQLRYTPSRLIQTMSCGAVIVRDESLRHDISICLRSPRRQAGGSIG